VVAPGEARAAAEALAAELAALPQLCLRSDRRSVYDGLGRPVADGLAREFELGVATLTGGTEVDRFRGGQGRGGAPVG